MTAFPNTMATPPGGEWFWEDRDVFIHSPSYRDAIDQIAKHFRDKGIEDDPAEALAAYMCPRMPRGFCRNRDDEPQPTVQNMLDATLRACDGKRLEMSREIQRRLEICEACQKCHHPVCVTCRNVDKAIYTFFDGRRPRLESDRRSGVCKVCGAFVMGLASVRHDEAMEGAPESCWRNKP